MASENGLELVSVKLLAEHSDIQTPSPPTAVSATDTTTSVETAKSKRSTARRPPVIIISTSLISRDEFEQSFIQSDGSFGKENYKNAKKYLKSLNTDHARYKILTKAATIHDPKKGRSRSAIHIALDEKPHFSMVSNIIMTIKDRDIRVKLLTVTSDDGDDSDQPRMVLERLMDEELDKMESKIPEKRSHMKSLGKEFTSKVDDFTLFAFDQDDEFLHMKRQHLLYLIAQSQSMNLINHDYVVNYKRSYWDQYNMKVLVWGTYTCYFLLNGVVTVSEVYMSKAGQDVYNKYKLALVVLCILPSLLLMCVEALQIKAKGTFYFKSFTNYLDLLVPLISLLAVIGGAYTEPESWENCVGVRVFVIFFLWTYGAYRLAQVPNIPPKLFQQFLPKLPDCIRHPLYIVYTGAIEMMNRTMITFMMFFEILKTVLFTLPVILFFCAMFAIAITVGGSSIGITEKGEFANLGHAMVTVLVMAIGDIPYTDYYHDDRDLIIDSAVMYAGGYLLLIFFMACLPVAGMNLLIGLAIDDVKEIKDRSTQKTFAYMVDSLIEYERIRHILTRKK